jgi:hypothetical protein
LTQVIDLLGYGHRGACFRAPLRRRERFIFVRHGETEETTTSLSIPHTSLNETGEARRRAPQRLFARPASAGWSARWHAPGAAVATSTASVPRSTAR